MFFNSIFETLKLFVNYKIIFACFLYSTVNALIVSSIESIKTERSFATTYFKVIGFSILGSILQMSALIVFIGMTFTLVFGTKSYSDVSQITSTHLIQGVLPLLLVIVAIEYFVPQLPIIGLPLRFLRIIEAFQAIIIFNTLSDTFISLLTKELEISHNIYPNILDMTGFWFLSMIIAFAFAQIPPLLKDKRICSIPQINTFTYNLTGAFAYGLSYILPYFFYCSFIKASIFNQ